MAELRIKKTAEGYHLHAETFVPRELDDVFEFFADASNLERLTPSWIRFRICTPLPIHMRAGRLIEYKLRIRGIRMRWRSEITVWEPTQRFVDEQRRGPYRSWRHEHRFEAVEGGTRVIDDVYYGVPGGPLVHALLVGRDLKKIFRFRQQTLEAMFGATQQSHAA
jgi:ligand-binding SRPBCC domain-containing protein